MAVRKPAAASSSLSAKRYGLLEHVIKALFGAPFLYLKQGFDHDW